MAKRISGVHACIAVAAVALAPASAQAKRTDENATTQSDDAFGRSVGSERSGLYSPDEVRGFSPTDAGNIRIHGLYFDLAERPLSRITHGNAIRVGIGAQRYPFPAPSGLVDYDLALPGAHPELSVEVDNGNALVRGEALIANLQVPIDGERLGFAGGYGARNAIRYEGERHKFRSASGLLAFRPAKGAEYLLFAAWQRMSEDEPKAIYFPAGNTLPPQVPRGKFLGLRWADKDTSGTLIGGIARIPLGEGTRIEAGLAWSEKRQPKNFSDFLFGVTPDGHTTSRIVYADGNIRDQAVSGEFRLVREWHSAAIDHTLTASLRGRVRHRLFGGSVALLLGGGSIFSQTGWNEPTYSLGPKNDDRVRQLTFGAAYNLYWRGGANLDVSVSKTRYRKALDFADPALPDPVTRDRPLLWNVSGSYAVAKGVIVYAGTMRGQEEALVAPDSAANRAEAPPAIRTKQSEAGVRLALAQNLALVAGVFSISKPYYNLDPAGIYRQLGTLTNRGVELSLTGKLAPGLSLVGGALLLDPRISGIGVQTRVIGKRPAGQAKRRIVANFDWRSKGGKGPVSIDVAVEYLSAKTANAANTFTAPSRMMVNLGARYRFSVGKVQLVLRPLLSNVFNDYGWNVSSIGGFSYTNRRNLGIDLIADF